MILGKRDRTYEAAAVFVQARYRGYRIRKLYRSSGSRRRKKRDKDMSADMLLLKMSTAGDVSTASLVQKEKQGSSTTGGSGMRRWVLAGLSSAGMFY